MKKKELKRVILTKDETIRELSQVLQRKERIIYDAYAYINQTLREAYNSYLTRCNEKSLNMNTTDIMMSYAIYVYLLSIKLNLENILYDGKGYDESN